MLFELLTGRPPYDTSGSLEEALHQICHTIPPRPSRLSRAVRADLDRVQAPIPQPHCPVVNPAPSAVPVTLDTDALAEGPHTIAVLARDGCNPQPGGEIFHQRVDQITVIVDRTPPVISFTMPDADLAWAGSPAYADDWVKAGRIGTHWYVFRQEPNGPTLAVTLSSDIPPEAYYAAKRGVDPDGAGGDPPFGYGTGPEIWQAHGIPPAWRDYVAGVGYDTPGVSGSAPLGSAADPDASVGLQFGLTLQPGEQTTLTLVQSCGATRPLNGVPCPDDVDRDSDVDLLDLSVVLQNMGIDCSG